jgi:transposase
MKNRVRYVGMDVHKETIVIAVADEGVEAPEVVAKIPNDWPTLAKHLKRLGPPKALRCCYEAGPTGHDLYRDLTAAGIACMVVAPALVRCFRHKLLHSRP